MRQDRRERHIANHRPGRRALRWLWLALVAAIAAGALVFVTRSTDHSGDLLVAERTSHDLGQVRMGDGLLSAQFPIIAREPVRVTGLATT